MKKTQCADSCVSIGGERFVLSRREIRNFYLRLHPDGTAHVSAPVWATDAQIEAFLRPRLAWLRKHRSSMAPQRADCTPAFEEGSVLWLFGQRYTLHQTAQGTPGLSFPGDRAVLCCASDAAAQQRRDLVLQAYRQALGAYLHARIPFYSARMGLIPPQYAVRLMRTRWGSCTPAAGRIRMNLRLAQKPKDWIDYVIVHELAHLRHADHSPAFWALVERYFPDWRALRRALNSGAYECL